MRNEILLMVSLVVIYGGVLLMYRAFGNMGLYCSTVFATIAANIEVLLLVDAFGMEQTLGNVLFASTFLISDILSENSGKEAANKAVSIGIISTIAFIIVSQSWLLYQPSGNDWAQESFRVIFQNTPRIMLASLAAYGISQRFDVWAYHKWWGLTSRKFGDSKRFLWVRNNGSTMISQVLNTLLYTFGAFSGIYSLETLINICISSYVIFIVTSLADTPVVYLARKLNPKSDSSLL